ncbi:MAG: hypothetical protein LBJ63_08130 [Prevotellaceae bacterium]|jgi:hypothetical protein|nr:hypothetical protein [Prevotellaceae bacterium]
MKNNLFEKLDEMQNELTNEVDENYIKKEIKRIKQIKGFVQDIEEHIKSNDIKTTINQYLRDKIISTYRLKLFLLGFDELENEIENNLFRLNKDDRSIYINRILSRVFMGRMYYFQIEKEHNDTERMFYRLYDNHFQFHFSNPKEKVNTYKKMWNVDYHYLNFVFRLIRIINDLIIDFNLKFDNQKYPLHKIVEYEKQVEQKQDSQRLISDNIVNKLVKDKIIIKKPLKWLKSKSLLAYFVVGMCEKDKLKHGQKRLLKPFENRFNVKGLSSAINDIKKVGTPPADYEMINKILDLPQNFFEDNFLNDK